MKRLRNYKDYEYCISIKNINPADDIYGQFCKVCLFFVFFFTWKLEVQMAFRW